MVVLKKLWMEKNLCFVLFMVPGFTFLNIKGNFNSTHDRLNRGMVHENALI